MDLYKYLRGIDKINNPQFELAQGRETRGNSLKLIKPRCRLNTRSSFFSEPVVTIWNSLPELVVSAPSVESFKSRLDNHWSSLLSMFDPQCYQCRCQPRMPPNIFVRSFSIWYGEQALTGLYLISTSDANDIRNCKKIFLILNAYHSTNNKFSHFVQICLGTYN